MKQSKFIEKFCVWWLAVDSLLLLGGIFLGDDYVDLLLTFNTCSVPLVIGFLAGHVATTDERIKSLEENKTNDNN